MNNTLNVDESSILIVEHQNQNILDEYRSIIYKNFNNEHDYYSELNLDEFRKLVALTQKEINDLNPINKICTSLHKTILSYLNDNFLVQSNCYLRAARPINNAESENIGWHRESFYSPVGNWAYNIWTPLLGVSKKNTLKYIPESQKILEKDISLEKTKDPYTKKFSDGHKIGLLYSPKKIKGGVNLENSKKLIVPYNSSAIFSGRLIHGSGENNDTIIRFSLDFRIIPKKDWNEYKSLDKSSHFSSGKSYFIEFSETQ